jgi:hypothetical protein
MKKQLSVLAILVASAGCGPNKSPDLPMQSPATQPHSRYTLVKDGSFRAGYVDPIVMITITDTKTGERWLLLQGPRGLSVSHSDHKEPVGGGK